MYLRAQSHELWEASATAKPGEQSIYVYIRLSFSFIEWPLNTSCSVGVTHVNSMTAKAH